ncbi:MAG: NADH-quinone oxidoreductase subunit J [Candidatus Omnitrophota bacterium]
MAINIILLIALLLASLWTVMTIRLIRSVVGLAITSAILSIIMFKLDAPLAAVFELSVCAGLISVIFVTTISFTQRLTQERLKLRRKERMGKFWYLPLIICTAAILLSFWRPSLNFQFPAPLKETDARNILWNMRHLDLLGQVIVLLAGAFGVVILFKEEKR